MATESTLQDAQKRPKLSSITPRAYLTTTSGYNASDSADFPTPVKLWITAAGTLKVDTAEGETATFTITDDEVGTFFRSGAEVSRVWTTGTTATYEIWK